MGQTVSEVGLLARLLLGFACSVACRPGLLGRLVVQLLLVRRSSSGRRGSCRILVVLRASINHGFTSLQRCRRWTWGRTDDGIRTRRTQDIVKFFFKQGLEDLFNKCVLIVSIYPVEASFYPHRLGWFIRMRNYTISVNVQQRVLQILTYL